MTPLAETAIVPFLLIALSAVVCAYAAIRQSDEGQLHLTPMPRIGDIGMHARLNETLVARAPDDTGANSGALLLRVSSLDLPEGPEPLFSAQGDVMLALAGDSAPLSIASMHDLVLTGAVVSSYLSAHRIDLTSGGAIRADVIVARAALSVDAPRFAGGALVSGGTLRLHAAQARARQIEADRLSIRPWGWAEVPAPEGWQVEDGIIRIAGDLVIRRPSVFRAPVIVGGALRVCAHVRFEGDVIAKSAFLAEAPIDLGRDGVPANLVAREQVLRAPVHGSGGLMAETAIRVGGIA
ncbi:hypothetical protein [Futiania mangrovi]|uniref:Uncharacterized protein n=1 Tax=Futiania mangrovi TaxID=2959716 RepID=A0A9J6P801_9PROT|nr:hypothetical protein [Futiania mangrovii]MCP1335548.1 hypothetical protein [Futiania mangrovii]